MAPAARADAWQTFQVLKGIGIVEVLLHHLFGFSAREFAVAQTPQWWVLMVANRLLHFAVPTFLLVSALVLTRGVVLQSTAPDWKRFYSRRTLKTVWPYVLWSGLYVCFRLFILARPQDVRPTPVVLSPALGGGEILLPALLATGESWQRIVLNGKAYFHLYFLAVLTQFSLVFPLLFVALRRMRLPFAALLGLTALLQGGVYVLQANYLRLPYPGSSMIWYVAPLLIGMWLGMNQETWQRIWARWHWLIGLVTSAGLALYLSLSLYRLSTGSYGPTGAISRVDSSATPGMAYNAGLIIYATGLSLLLLVGSERLATALVPSGNTQRAHWGERVKRSLARGLEWFGTYSMPMYLLHPLVFEALKTPALHGVVDRLPLSPLWAGMLLFGVSGLLSWLCWLSGVDVLLFGRRLVLTPVRPRNQGPPSAAVRAVPADVVPVADISPDLGAVELPLDEQLAVAAVQTPGGRNSEGATAPVVTTLPPREVSAASLPMMALALGPPRPSRRRRRSSAATRGGAEGAPLFDPQSAARDAS